MKPKHEFLLQCSTPAECSTGTSFGLPRSGWDSSLQPQLPVLPSHELHPGALLTSTLMSFLPQHVSRSGHPSILAPQGKSLSPTRTPTFGTQPFSPQLPGPLADFPVPHPVCCLPPSVISGVSLTKVYFLMARGFFVLFFSTYNLAPQIALPKVIQQ